MTAEAKFTSIVTPIVLTYDEAPNIERCLARLGDFPEVLVVDSGSTDDTVAIAAGFSNTRLLQRPFDTFAGQWNFALREGNLKTEWALAMDADYILTDGLLDEIANLTPPAGTVAYRMGFNYCVLGRKLSGTLYPPLIALYRHRAMHYIPDGHTMRPQISGSIGSLQHRADHDDRKPLSRWLTSQCRYAEQESELLLSRPLNELRIQDRLRRAVVVTPWLVPIYCLTAGRGILDGWAGIYYAIQRALAEAVLSLKMIEHIVQRREN